MFGRQPVKFGLVGSAGAAGFDALALVLPVVSPLQLLAELLGGLALHRQLDQRSQARRTGRPPASDDLGRSLLALQTSSYPDDLYRMPRSAAGRRNLALVQLGCNGASGLASQLGQDGPQILGARLGLVTGADRTSVDAAQSDPLRFLGSERVLGALATGAPSRREPHTDAA